MGQPIKDRGSQKATALRRKALTRHSLKPTSLLRANGVVSGVSLIGFRPNGSRELGRSLWVKRADALLMGRSLWVKRGAPLSLGEHGTLSRRRALVGVNSRDTVLGDGSSLGVMVRSVVTVQSRDSSHTPSGAPTRNVLKKRGDCSLILFPMPFTNAPQFSAFAISVKACII